ncbi:MAG: hypothetical protein WC744_01620 [Patescibacteria group bacterium]|jgi:hypothetical protein
MEKRKKQKHKESPAKNLKIYFALGLATIALSFALSSCNTPPETNPRPSQVQSIEMIVGNYNGASPVFYGNDINLEWNTAGRISSIDAPSVLSSPCVSTVQPDIPEDSVSFDIRASICRDYLDLAKTLSIPENKRVDFVLFLASHTIEVDLEFVKIICENEKAGACVTTDTDPNFILTNSEENLPHETVHIFSKFFEPGYHNISDIACVTHLRDGTFKFIMKSEEKGYDETFTSSGEYLATIIEAGASYTDTTLPIYIRNAPEDIKNEFRRLGEAQRNNSDLSLLPLLVPDNLLSEPGSVSVSGFFDRAIKLFGGLDKFLELSFKFDELIKHNSQPVYSEINMQEACGIGR